MIVIGSNTSDNGPSGFTEDVSHFIELRQNRQLALLKRSAKNETKALGFKLKRIMPSFCYISVFVCPQNSAFLLKKGKGSNSLSSFIPVQPNP